MLTRLMSLPIWVRLTASVLVAMTLSLGGITVWSARQQERLAIDQARQFSDGFTHLITVGIATTMAAGDAGEIKAFLDQLRRDRSVKSLKVLRGQAVIQQFGQPAAGAAQPDPAEQRVLAQGQPHSAVEETADGLVYRAVVPMPASQNFMGRDCLKCHEAREGSVLGAVSLQIGLDQVRQAGRDFQRSAFLAAALFGALIVGALYLLCSRTVSRPLAEAAAQLRDISEGDGDLTKRLRVRSRDEVGELGAVFNVFADKLHGVMVDVRRASDHASGVAHQLSAASEQLAAGAQEQASSLEETAASLEEITGTVKQNADNARQANQLAAGSREVAEKGGQVVRDAMASMSEINRSSKKIADIITTIDEIAFQTNLLALNAAVEAARAGEQGRGFAVVASEVRNLAQRSATAAKEIKGLIQDSVQKVEAGSELVNKSGETLNEIVGSVKRVTDIIAEIAAASQEQSTGIDQVNKAVTQMDQVTQSNAAQTEELSSTAQSLATQAEQLQGLVARFKLDDGAAHTGAAPSTTALAPKASPVRSMPTPVVRAPKRPPADPALVSAHTPNGNSSPHAGNDGFEEF